MEDEKKSEAVVRDEYTAYEVVKKPPPIVEDPEPGPLPGPVTYTISIRRDIILAGRQQLEEGHVVGELTVDCGLDPTDICRHMDKLFRMAPKR